MDEINPYVPPVHGNNTYKPPSRLTMIHTWDGRTIAVDAYLCWLGLMTGYTITLDSGETFSSSQLKPIENFTWEFEHQGRSVEGRFKGVGINWGLCRRYELFVDGQSLGLARVWFRGIWKIPVLWTLAGLLTHFGLKFMR